MGSDPPRRCRRIRYRGRRLDVFEATREAKAADHALDVTEADAAAQLALDWLDEIRLDISFERIRRW